MMPLALRLAGRELRGGLRGFRVFLLCLSLGVMAIAAVGTLRGMIAAGLADQGAVLLGGDARLQFTYRFASEAERDWMAARALQVSEVVDFRSMIVVGEDRALTQVKAVDDLYPLVGALRLEPDLPLDQALAGRDGLPGAVLDPVLAARLGLAIGDSFRLGAQDFVLMARLIHEPDSLGGGFSLGPRSLVRRADLAASGLIGPGTLFDSEYRLTLPAGTDLDRLQAEAEAEFADSGLRWNDRRSANPGVDRFVARLSDFLVLVGLAGLAVGGVGIATAVRAWAEARRETLGILRVLGADGRLILAVILAQVLAVSALGIAVGLLFGALLPMLAAPILSDLLPFPLQATLSPRALVEAGFYGVLTALIFSLWPLSGAARQRAAALFRGGAGARPGWTAASVVAGLALTLIGTATLLSGNRWLALGTAGGIAVALALLALAGMGLRRSARRLAHRPRGRLALRAALAALGAPRGEAVPALLALGLGLTVLAAMGQIDANLRRAIAADLPTRAPAFYVLDIQPDQIDAFRKMLADDPEVGKVEAAPMLRGVLSRINGRPAAEVAGDHWVVRGDRGLTTLAGAPADLASGKWWPADYSGPPQLAFSAKEGAEIGLKLGDRLSVNVLGREIEAELVAFRNVDFSSAGMGFIMTLNPGALAGAPQTHIATIHAPPDAEARLMRDLGRAFPNITLIAVRGAIARAAEALGAIATATATAAASVMLTGLVVLVGTAAAGEGARAREAAILKVLGATRGMILRSFALRAALLGAMAGAVALVAGSVAAWAVIVWVMEGEFMLAPLVALAIVGGGALASLLAGLAFALRPLRARPAQVLRATE